MKRYLLKINTSVGTKNGMTTIKSEQYEANGNNLYTLPDLSIFKDTG